MPYRYLCISYLTLPMTNEMAVVTLEVWVCLAHGLRDAGHVVRQLRLPECEVLVTLRLLSGSREREMLVFSWVPLLFLVLSPGF